MGSILPCACMSNMSFDAAADGVCVRACKHVCLFTQQHRRPVARMAVIFSEWFSPLGKWRENKSWVYMSHAEYTEGKLFSFFLWTQFCSAAETSRNNSSQLELEGNEPDSAVEVKSSPKNLDYLKNDLDFGAFIRRHLNDSATVSYSYFYCYIVHCSKCRDGLFIGNMPKDLLKVEPFEYCRMLQVILLFDYRTSL